MIVRFTSLLLLLLFAVATARATITPIQVVPFNNAAGGSQTSVTFTVSAVTTGSTCIIGLSSAIIDQFKVVAGANEKDWICVGKAIGAASSNFAVLLAFKAITGGQTSITISTQATGTGRWAGVFAEFIGANITPDVWRGVNSATSTALSTLATDTTNYANELVVAMFAQRAPANVTAEMTSWASLPTNSFSIVGQTSCYSNAAVNLDRMAAMATRIVTTTGSFSTAVTSTQNNLWVSTIMTFREIPQVVSTTTGD